jgi:hypothetical protein
MRADADFEGYLAARWPTLVRTLVLLGCPQEIASDVALDAVAECRAKWAASRARGDVDVVVHHALLTSWDERRRTPWWQDLEPPETSVGAPAETMRHLDQLTPEVRTLLVLQRHAGLDRGQSVAALGHRGADDLAAAPTAAELRTAVVDVPVLAPPDAQALVQSEREQHQRRRARHATRALAVAVPVLLVAAGIAWQLSRGEPDDALESVAVQHVENPAEVAWYADGRLHLDHVVLDVPAVRQLAPVRGGAAYGDEQGRVVYVGADGSRTVLGHKEPATALVVSNEHGWVVWAAADGADQRLVVHELSTSSTVATRELVPAGEWDGSGTLDADGVQPVALDGGTVYYMDGAGGHAWTVASNEVEDLGANRLVDAREGLKAYQVNPGVIQVAPSDSGGFAVPGAGADFSRGGDLVLTRDVREQASFGPVLLYDTQTGADVSVGLGAADVALAAQLGPDRTVTYIIARAEDRPENADFLRSSFSGQLELRTCDVDTGQCEALERFPSTGSRPLLAY